MGTAFSEPSTSTVELFDGRAGLLRPIRPVDADALRSFHASLSSSTVRRRFFYLHPELTVAEVDRFTNVNGTDRVAFVVETTGGIVAVGRYERMGDPTGAEVAFVVADAYQHHGLGSLLLARLVERAREVGITTFYAEILDGNRAMLGVLRDSGYPMTSTEASGVVKARLDIASTRSCPGSERHRPGEAGAPAHRGSDLESAAQLLGSVAQVGEPQPIVSSIGVEPDAVVGDL